jgi:hypothetical protein
MKRVLKVILIISLILSLSSCAIHSGLTFNTNNNVTNVVLQGNNYKIVQKVKGEASGLTVLGIGGSFRALIENARSDMLSKANLMGRSRAIINETVEVNNKFFVVFWIKTITVSAYVIEFTDNNNVQQSIQQIENIQQPSQQEKTQQQNIQPQQQIENNSSAIQLQEQSTFVGYKSIESNGYLNFEEFKKGNPSLSFNCKLDKIDSFTYGIFNIIPKTDTEKINKEIWGIRVDGIDYINAYPYKKTRCYNEIEGKGYYSYFIGNDAFTFGIGYVILPTGYIQKLTSNLLLELCADNEDIIKEVKDAKLKNGDFNKMFKILEKYNLTKE